LGNLFADADCCESTEKMKVNHAFCPQWLCKYIFSLVLGFVCLQLYAQTSGLHIGAYHEDPTANPEDPTPGLIYFNLPAGDEPFKGLMDFTFVGCQSKSVGVIQGEKKNGALKGEFAGQVDYTAQTGSYTGRYIAKDKYYTGTYIVNKGKQFVKVPNCIEYYIAPHGTWSIFELNHTFSESKPYEPISLNNGVAKWSLPPGATIASISLVDKNLAVSGAKNAVLHQLIIPASLKNYRLPAQYAKFGKTYVISVIASNGRKVVYFSSIEFPEKAGGNSAGRETPPTIKGSRESNDNKVENTDDEKPTPTVSIPFQPNSPSKPASPRPIIAKSPSISGGKPVPKVEDPAASECAGVYEGMYGGELQGKLRIGINKNGMLFEGLGSTGSRGELVGIETFRMAGQSETECDTNMAGTWVAPLLSAHAGKTQYMRFTGFVSQGEINGRYRYDNNPSSSMMGSFHLIKVK
jgi:hypothetical protein